MKIYLVGGAVRDLLLGIEVKDRDFVVVGSNPEEMLSMGFRQVGSEFPVFLHPATNEEFALARTERKVGVGYHGFEFDAGENVTLEDDLRRRDITINAMAIPVVVDSKSCDFNQKDIIDPFGGREDLKNGILRHVSDAFVEDPVRALRIARFAAHFDFTIAQDTKILVRSIVDKGELNYLTSERVWLECKKALFARNVDIFFVTLRELEVLKVIFPEIDKLFELDACKQGRLVVDAGSHAMMSVRYVCQITTDLETRFAVLLQDLGNVAMPKAQLPSHKEQEESGLYLVKALCNRLKVPTKFKELAIKVCEYHHYVHMVEQLEPKTILKVFQALDVFRKPKRLKQLLDAAEADFYGFLGREDKKYHQREVWEQIFAALSRISSSSYIKEGFKNKEIVNALFALRLSIIKETLQ